MIKNISIAMLLITIAVFAQDEMPSDKQKLENPMPAKVLVVDGVEPETNSTNPVNWNVTDFKKYIENETNGTLPLNSSLPTNTQSILNSINSKKAKTAFSGNYNQLTTGSLLANETFSDDDAIQKGFDEDLKDTIIGNSIDNPFVNLLDAPDAIKCYIARDIAFRWECPIDNMVYGGEMQSDGRNARLNCENNCFTQHSCAEVGSSKVDNNITYTDLECDFSANPSGCNFIYSISPTGIDVNTIKTHFEANNAKDFKLSVDVVDFKNESHNLITSMSGILIDDNLSINVYKSIKQLSLYLKPINTSS